jgi:hypothetical protein
MENGGKWQEAGTNLFAVHGQSLTATIPFFSRTNPDAARRQDFRISDFDTRKTY